MKREEKGAKQCGIFREPFLLFASAGYVGNIPGAPGTYGSAIGCVIGLFLFQAFSASVSLVILAVSFVPSVLICGRAERHIGKTDPSSVVLDEVWAMAVIIAMVPKGFLSGGIVLLMFLVFRFFDIVKPPPLKRLARAPGGLGIMLDDAGAAAYTLIILWIANLTLAR